MTAFLRIDTCSSCRRSLPWEWIPTVVSAGRPLAGTGVWRSQLLADRCAACLAALNNKREAERVEHDRRERVVEILGGEQPYREFTFQRFAITAGNRLAYEKSMLFDPTSQNLYFWGPCGIGKTHLACAAASRCIEETLSVGIFKPWQLVRRARMKHPDEEQLVIDQAVATDMLVLDDFGGGVDSAYQRQLILEILDGRIFNDRAGLVITTKYSLAALANKMNDDAIPSRLAGLCQVIELRGKDHRLDVHDL